MSNGWQKVYQELQDFISVHPDIEIEKSSIVIPADIRPEFYRSFDKVRLSFLEEKYPGMVKEAKGLSENYVKVEQEITGLLSLESISTSPPLHRFLHNALNELIAEMFYPLFDLLKEKIDLKTFEQKASMDTEAGFRKLYRPGYEKWVTLSLVKLLLPDKIFDVTHPKPEFDDEEVLIHRKLQSPNPKESKTLSLEPEQFYSFIVPHFIVHSTKINQYVAIRTELGDAADTVENSGKKREWNPLKSITTTYGFNALNPSLLIYLDEKPEHIALVADMEKICRPDLIIECKEQNDWYGKDKLEKVKKEHDILKPRLGTYVVSREPVPEQAYLELAPEPTIQEAEQTSQNSIPEKASPEHLPEQKAEMQKVGIHILDVGFDLSKLEPIIEAMSAF